MDSQELFHGTTFRGVLGIMHRGFEGSSNPARHEFSSKCGLGVYCADKWHGSLYYHATATKFTVSTRTEPDGTPYVRSMFVVEATRLARKVESYDRCKQVPLA